MLISELFSLPDEQLWFVVSERHTKQRLLLLLRLLQAQARGTSAMQPIKPAAAGLGSKRSAAEVGSEAFVALAEAEITPEDLFFHRQAPPRTAPLPRAPCPACDSKQSVRAGASATAAIHVVELQSFIYM